MFSNSFDGCVESVRIRSYSASYFPAFGLNTERYGVFSRNAGKYGPQKLSILESFCNKSIELPVWYRYLVLMH